MTHAEKIGLVFIMAYMTSEFPPSWRGLDAIFFMFALVLFFSGKQIQAWIDNRFLKNL